MKEIGKLIVILLCVVLVVVFDVATSFNDTEYTVTVTDKERVVEGESSYYLVFTEDKNGKILVFENEDNVLRGKFDSSNVQGELKIGYTYDIVVVGYRVPFLSMYQNIIEVRSVSND